MEEYKLRTGISYTYKVTTKYDFEEQTGNNRDYQYVGKDGIKRGLAVCPSCDNPVRILGLYEELDGQKAHARHHNRDTAFASYDSSAYFHCPRAEIRNVRGTDFSNVKREPSEYEKRMYNTMREYFDKAVYILNQDLSLYVSHSFAKRLLQEFVANRGYMSSDSSIYNLPWMLLDKSFSFNLIGMRVRRTSELHQFLSLKEDIILVPYTYHDKDNNEVDTEYDLIKPQDNHYVILIGHFIQHTRIVASNDMLKENIVFGLSDSNSVPIHWIYREKYNINEHRFPNLCVKGKDKHRNQKLLDIAQEIMPEL